MTVFPRGDVRIALQKARDGEPLDPYWSYVLAGEVRALQRAARVLLDAYSDHERDDALVTLRDLVTL